MPDRLYLLGADVLDLTRDGRPRPGQAVVVEGDRIAGVVPAASVPVESEGRRVELPHGTTLLPGLIDMHVHLTNWSAPAEIAASPTRLTAHAAGHARATQKRGITTVRDVGSAYGVSYAIRDAVAAGEILGSRVFAAGHILCMTGGHGTEMGNGHVAVEVDGPDAARRQVRQEAKEGADLIKVALDGRRSIPGRQIVEFTQSEVDAIVDEAHRLGLKVAAHVFYPESTAMAVRAGADTIEHGLHLDDDNVRELAAAGTVLVPTLRLPLHILDRRAELVAGSEYGRHAVAHAEMAVETHAASFQRALEGGVKIAAGTDTATLVGGVDLLVHDLEYMVELGMSPVDAIRSATMTPAATLDHEGRLGTLAAGAFADILVCHGDPTVSVSALHDVALVIQNGKVVAGSASVGAGALPATALAG
jgi:imidazolonepropionase-like amidohydrolase